MGAAGLNDASAQESGMAFEVLVMFNVNPDLRAFYDAEERARLLREGEISEIRQEERQEGRREGHREGRREGLQEGELIGSIRVYQKLLGLPQTPSAELAALSEAELVALLDQLSGQLEQRHQ
jgi:flagellar biosynthesis/type III secretory pathway protein FliH